MIGFILFLDVFSVANRILRDSKLWTNHKIRFHTLLYTRRCCDAMLSLSQTRYVNK